MKIITVKKLSKIKFDNYEMMGDEETATAWAKYLGATELYKFVRPNGILWKVKK